MRTSQDVIAHLVARTRALAGDADPEMLRSAYAQVLSDLPAPGPEHSAWSDGTDVLGGAYERLLSGDQRRAAGQFFTPFWAGELMAGWLLSEPTDLLLDPGCGSGALLIPAARSSGRGDASLLGIERDPLALRMAELNRALHRIPACELRRGDFLVDALEERPDAIVCNPPYSRHHEIPADAKAAIHEGFERRLGLRLSRLAGLHVLFLVRALEVCADGGRLAFITPSDWLDVSYGERVKRFVLERAHVEAIVLLEAQHLFFDGVLTTAGIWLIRREAQAGSRTKVIRLRRALPPAATVLAALRGESGLPVEEVSLCDLPKWSRPKPKRARGVRLRDVARIRRGIATGCNRFFVLSEARRRELGIPHSQLRPCLTSPRVLPGTELRREDLDSLRDEVPRWILDCRDGEEEGRDTSLGAYLRFGRAEFGAHAGYLARRRNPWFALERRGDSPILFTYFNRARPRFARNHASAVPLNTWLIVEPAAGVDADQLFTALSCPSVMGQLGQAARVYGGGLWKLEPSELGEIRLPSAFAGPGQLRLNCEE